MENSYILEKVLQTKEEEKFIKELSEKFWLRRATKETGKIEDEYRLIAAAANREGKEAQEWIDFLKKEIKNLGMAKA